MIGRYGGYGNGFDGGGMAGLVIGMAFRMVVMTGMVACMVEGKVYVGTAVNMVAMIMVDRAIIYFLG